MLITDVDPATAVGLDQAHLFSSVIKPMFDAASGFMDGPVVLIAAAIAGFLLTVHAMLGGAEMVMDKERCRFFDPRFIFRILFVCGLLIFGKKIFFTPIQNATMTAMDGFLEAWINALGQVATAVQAGIDNMIAMVSEQGGMAIFNLSIEVLFKGLIAVFATGLGSVIAILSMVLMLLVALVGCGTIALTVSVAPIYIAFGLSEVTQSLALNYFRVWFGTCILYLPFLLLSMKISVVVSLAPLVQWASPQHTTTELWSNFWGVMLGPLIGLCMVFVGPRVVKSLTSAH